MRRPIALLVLVLALTGCSHSTPNATPVVQPSPYGVVMVATLEPGADVGNAAERFAKMRGVGSAGGRPGTFRVVVRAHATVEQYLAVRKALAGSG